jgi:FAD/FMN-containing dehydrogenase
MIPRLTAAAQLDSIYLVYISELRARGFDGEISQLHADRIVLATDNSIYQITPQAIAFPKSNDDLVRLLTLAAEERFHAITLTVRGGGTGQSHPAVGSPMKTLGQQVELSRCAPVTNPRYMGV